MVALASWTYAGMKRSTDSIAASELKTILNADVTALQLWIEEKTKDVRLWSSRPDVQQAVRDLASVAENNANSGDELRSSPALQHLRDVLEQYDRTIGRPERDGVVTRDGLILAADHDELIGGKLNGIGVAMLVPVFQGKTIFLKPNPHGAFGIDEERNMEDPEVQVVAPVYRDESLSGDIVAAAAFGFLANDEFTRILSVARQGETGETYAFDANGVLLNESRFDNELRSLGLLPNDPSSRSILRIEIREPPENVGSGPATPVETAALPLTKLAAAAIAAGRMGDESDHEGVLLEPYRNYRGALVIGAWKWLPAYAMGVATEVEVAEQYAPMRYPLIAEWVRSGLLAACLVALLIAASWIAILGQDLETTRKLGQYTLEAEIGRGGMGIVYRATHAFLQRPTAIKLLRAEIINETSLARFHREVQIASGLTHPNTIDIFDFGQTPDGSFYCVMEFLDGRTLEEWVESRGPLSAHRVANILEQIAGSLNEAHQRGLIHRDIKPTNIMRCEQGGIADFIKVLDFGLARSVEPLDSNDVTKTGLVMGTPSYMAPERITEPTIIDQRSDIFAFGAVGYFLLCARHIYDASNRTSELTRKIANYHPRRPSEVTSNEIPADLDELIVCCLQRRPEDRPDTMQEVLRRVSEIAARHAP